MALGGVGVPQHADRRRVARTRRERERAVALAVLGRQVGQLCAHQPLDAGTAEGRAGGTQQGGAPLGIFGIELLAAQRRERLKQLAYALAAARLRRRHQGGRAALLLRIHATPAAPRRRALAEQESEHLKVPPRGRGDERSRGQPQLIAPPHLVSAAIVG
jgi:hypothetical protein